MTAPPSHAPVAHPAPAQPRLLEQVRNAIARRHYSVRTEQAYVHWIRRFIFFHDKRHPRDLGESDVTAFLIHLARERDVAAATQNQALSALLLLYKELLVQRLPCLVAPPATRRPAGTPLWWPLFRHYVTQGRMISGLLNPSPFRERAIKKGHPQAPFSSAR